MPAFRHPPAAERPTSPGADYGVPQDGGELVSWAFVAERLASALAYWLATVRPDRRPHAMPVWGVFMDDDLFLETSPRTRKARNLALNPSAVVHTADPDQVVVVEGTVQPVRPSFEMARQVASAFNAKYPGYEPSPATWDGGGLYVVQPRLVLAWRGMPTATRWRFDGS